ncbi:MAG: hypothetical protein JSV95_06040 [Gemmatimonadota bacterium]|nr:MAG: hypothetical protein JSV95_06040 [Gemmatimonadota bacterium]
MITRGCSPRNERGAAIIQVALSLTILLSIGALAVDFGMLYTKRTELQRTADAAALAGASAFIDYPVKMATDPAHKRAMRYALAHSSPSTPISAGQVSIEVLPAEEKVRVRIDGTAGTFFARMLDVHMVDVAAVAAAEADVGATQAVCVKPLAIPDRWLDEDDDDGNRIWDEPESWVYEPDAPGMDYYAQFGSDNPTGYGSDFTYDMMSDYPADYGRPITIKAAEDTADPSDAPVDSFFFPWVMPASDGRVGECRWQSEGESGADPYRANLCNCNMSTITLDREYETENGDMEGPTFQGIQELMKADPDAHWDPVAHVVKSSKYADNTSPRVIKIATFDPAEYMKPGKTTLRFNNFLKVFVESQPSEDDPVRARFMGFTSGVGAPSESGGTLVKVVRLVE